ncbi:alanine or glycine:cation symporter, AGCS family [Butyricicoccus pullicaecorum DSM 23266]|uniref:Amino acid carrier protein n=3 Tax=Butyricicoccus pullicaecorum TaxID=501571 RepID=R8VX33_9FIRM|nr:sodium:alanine symporter family protein [Butyricicoccus pullicaecorum]EOQ35452.1 amino acid carrier protein [Butyricicoccus pullicaecorum 1.2]OUP52995.1 sodium:alanine symporter family protein [Butyricicoccus pullicaecorum]SKA63764.1 alanine or glycine:cation symporter, AGCS family [Butyricicoccus pullicaecorum DSM 23266]
MDMDQLAVLVSDISGFVWNNLLLYLLVLTGVLFSIRTRFVQVRHLGTGFKRMFGSFSLNGKKADHEGMSSFQALTTAIAAQVGTGNITGCATALASGGPGAIFWMWLSAFFGMSTIYGEAVLAQKYKTVGEDGHVTGGPIYYIKARFKGGFGTFLAGFFSIAIIFALGFAGNMVQSNSIGDSFHNAFGISPLIVGVICAAIAAFIFLGGVKRIASVTEKLVPVMALFYILGCTVILVINHAALIESIKSIFIGAFQPQALAGGIAGVTVKEAMRYGVARGLFSNEAGMGSTPHAHALAKVKKPQDQGIIAMVGVFIDTFIILTLTALVILTSGALSTGATGSVLAQTAFNQAFGQFGSVFIAICMLFFAFSTIIGWYFFGEVNVKALFGKKAVKIYAALVVVCVILGSSLKVDLVWNLSDLFNGLMVFPNLIALIALSGVVAKMSHEDH